MTKGVKFFAVAVGLAASQSCTVHQTEAPPLGGPSEFAQSVTMTASPDSIKLGVSATARGESSTVVVQVLGPDASPQVGKPVRLDVTVGSVISDCGTLAQHDLFTATNGRAVTVFTAPGTPLPQPECSGFDGTVTIEARVGDSNFQTSVRHSVSIRMLPPTVISPPGGPTVNFTISPNPGKPLQPVAFTDAGSAAAPGRSITSYQWDFSDGATKMGPAVTHDFNAGSYTAALTVTDDIGQQTSKSAVVTITP